MIDTGKYKVEVGGRNIDLTYSEFNILSFLARRPGWVFTRQQIVDAVRGENYAVTERSIDVQIVGLRKKLGDHGTYIETVRGIGYRFKEEDA
jgi:two-component system phosphate regulon response regulator PhoB